MNASLIKPVCLALLATLAAPALAQDDDLDLDDILGESSSSSASEEIDDLRSGRDDVTSDELEVEPQPRGERRVIKTLQRKNFLKLGRYEVSPHLGFVTNDPFINRYLVGAGAAYHLTEIFALEVNATYSPDFGTGDWKNITHQLVEENRVSPDISKIAFMGDVNFQFSPIYGKLAVVGDQIINFDVYGTFGTGVVNTQDDLVALQCEQSQQCIQTQSQWHPTTNFGGGFRVIFNDNFAARLQGRSMVYIETVDSTTLEYKNNVMLEAGVSFFFPGVE